MTDVRNHEAPTLNRQGRSGPNPVGDFIWYELMTPDPEAANRFYSRVVGWEFGPAAAEYMGYRMINTRDGGSAGGVLELTAEMQMHGGRPGWLGYLNVHDVDDRVASIEGAGGRTYVAPRDIPDVGRFAMLADPQGAPFYVMKPIAPAGRENEPSDVFCLDRPGRCAWNELSSSDPVAARRFYGDQFGWTADDFMPMGERGEYRFIDNRGLRLGAIAPAMEGNPSHWRFYFRVPDIGEAAAQVEANGGKVLMGPMEVPGGDRILIGNDPQGAEFALVGGA